MDRMTRAQRHYCMSRIRSKNTQPEWRVRRQAFAMGYRYRLHDNRLPGKPDLVFPKLRKVIFVHGCFWHGHECKKRKKPETNSRFWEEKFEKNRMRDQTVLAGLWKAGWEALVIWECETTDAELLREKLADFLQPPSQRSVEMWENASCAAESGESYEKGDEK